MAAKVTDAMFEAAWEEFQRRMKETLPGSDELHMRWALQCALKAAVTHETAESRERMAPAATIGIPLVQYEILERLAQGKSRAHVAQELCISTVALHRHLEQAFETLKATQEEALLMFHRREVAVRSARSPVPV